jgi:hypothetical protein
MAAARVGRLTGSCACDMLATIKSGEAAARRRPARPAGLERLTGQPQDDCFVSKDMQRGTDIEPAAFAAYEALTGQMVAVRVPRASRRNGRLLARRARGRFRPA